MLGMANMRIEVKIRIMSNVANPESRVKYIIRQNDLIIFHVPTYQKTIY